MKKITQNLTNVKAWQSMVFAFMFLFSLTINSQDVGQEYLTNPSINTATGVNSTSPETGVDGGGNFPANLGGWSNGTGGAYASATAANGDCLSADRMFKFNKVGGADGQYVNQTITGLPAGIYNWSFFTKWGDAGHSSGPTGSAPGNLPTWSDEGDNEPKFTILVQDANGAWVADQVTVLTEPTTALTWLEDSGTWTNTETRDVRIKFAKNGGTAANGGSNTDKVMFIDDASLTYASALEATSDCDFSITLTDSYGDSWNGGSVDVSVGGVVVLDDITVSTTDNAGVFATYTFGVNDGDEISVVYTAGSYSYENEYEVFDNSGAVIASSGQGGSTPADSTTTASCIDLTAPAMSVTATTDGGFATFSFDIANFVVGSEPGEGDGHIHWSIFDSSDLENAIFSDMLYSSDDITNAFPNGDHVIVFSLVDPNHQPLDPAVEATVEFSTFDGTAACGETVTYTQVANGNYSVGATAGDGEIASVTVSATMEEDYDFLYVTDGAGNALTEQITGSFTGTFTSSDGTINVQVINDSLYEFGDVILVFACGPAPIVAPWSDDFQDGDISDWSIVTGGDVTQGWFLADLSVAIDGGSLGMVHVDDQGAINNYLVSPFLDLTSLSNPILSYDEGSILSAYYTYHGVLTSVDFDGTNAATATWIEIAEGPTEDNVSNTREYAIPVNVTGIAFNYQGNYSDYWILDNVSVTEALGEPNFVTADPANAWGGYMSVFGLNEDGTQGDYVYGSGWGVADLQTTLNVDIPNIILEPNFNTYANAIADGSAGELDFWTDGAGGGNKFMEATTQVESFDIYNGADLTFTGTVLENTLVDGYTAVYFIKCLDPNNGYSDMLGGAYVFPIEAGEFSVTVDGSMLPEGKLVQFGFTVYGPNANAENANHGRVVIGEQGLSTVDVTALDMIIYPNPSNGSYVTIQSPVNGVKYVEVFDITGKRLINTSLSADTLDVSSISTGMYFVKVTIEGQSKTSKLMIR